MEGTVIVGSILLAFGIQAWWDESQDRAEERRVLATLLAEFEESGEVLQQALGEYRQRYSEAAQLLELIEASAPGIDAATFDPLLRSVLTSQTFHLESGAHAALLGSGNMDLISDEVLRNHLAAWPSYVAEWSEEEDAVFALAGDVILPYVAQHLRLRDVGRPFAPFLNGAAPQPIPVGSIDAASRALLSTSLEFENLVYRRAQSTWYALRDGETLQTHLSAVVSRIRSNLDG